MRHETFKFGKEKLKKAKKQKLNEQNQEQELESSVRSQNNFSYSDIIKNSTSLKISILSDESYNSGRFNFKKCKGYKPSNFEFKTDESSLSNSESIYSNFPFQVLDNDNDRENTRFVIENEAFHSFSCLRRHYRLQKKSLINNEMINRSCHKLANNKHLQNILKRAQIKENFNSIPHSYLTYNQLKKELNHYRDSIKRFKLENLNLKRTIDSLRSKEDNYKKFINLLALNEYSKLSQIITVCLNQKKGINGIIERLLDSSEGVYRPKENNTMNIVPQFEEVNCKICNDKVNLFKMREHVSKHILENDVEENAKRCGFCGQVNTCTISIKNTSESWPESNCAYFKNFNFKNHQVNQSNRPVECALCSNIVWSFNIKAHYREMHPEDEFASEMLISENGHLAMNDAVTCKICHELCKLSKMRDHVARHILMNEVLPDAIRCGFCGQVEKACSIEIRATSGKGKNITYGPMSNCKYYRKFNLKSSSKPTRSKPSTNRPIQCHLCKSVCWSYNMKEHFGQKHPQEPPPELITELERDFIFKF
jgi:hypothetical protein